MDSALFVIRLLLAAVFLVGLAGGGWLVWQILRQQGRLLLRIEATEARFAEKGRAPLTAQAGERLATLPVGMQAPDFERPDLDGNRFTLSSQPMTTAASHSNGTGATILSGPPAAPAIGEVVPDCNLPDRETNLTFSVADLARAQVETSPTQAEGKIELTIGMATYHDFDGVYFTLQALRLYQDLSQTELLVIDNYGCQHTKNLVEGWLGARYIRATEVVGTAAPRELIFREARGKAVLCCDCHVLFAPGAIARLQQFYREYPDCLDLLQGPLLYDDGKLLSTHFDPVWREQMWGTWGTDPRGLDPEGEPFEIPMQGLGVFSCRKSAWLGFHPEFRGFGGEEGYLHEKFRQAGRRCLCLPWLRWMHRFSRPSGARYPLYLEDKLRNYVLGHAELGLDLDPVLDHFSHFLPRPQVMALAERTLGRRWAGSAQTSNGMAGPRHGQQQAIL